LKQSGGTVLLDSKRSYEEIKESNLRSWSEDEIAGKNHDRGLKVARPGRENVEVEPEIGT